jgi:hypothetical protein
MDWTHWFLTAAAWMAIAAYWLGFYLWRKERLTIEADRDAAMRLIEVWRNMYKSEERGCKEAEADARNAWRILNMARASGARARLAANAIGQQHGADWARGIASRALSPKHYWRLEAAIEREVARAEDRVDNVDVAAVLKRHRREALRGGEG